MADTCVELQRLSNLLGTGATISSREDEFKTKTPVLTKPDGSSVTGLVSISKYLAKKSSNGTSFYGGRPEHCVSIDQWLEYLVTHLNRCSQEKELQSTLQELNSYLSERVYFVGTSLSLADLLFYYFLSYVVSDLSFYEKEKYLNLSRWFNNIQHEKKVSSDLKEVLFQRNLLYGPTRSDQH